MKRTYKTLSVWVFTSKFDIDNPVVNFFGKKISTRELPTFLNPTYNYKKRAFEITEIDDDRIKDEIAKMKRE